MNLGFRRKLIGRRTPRPFRWIILVVTALVSFAVYWSHLTLLPEIVRATGQMAPLGELRKVGHFDGGVVEDVSIRSGDRVMAGEVIARVSQPNISENLARVRQQLDAATRDAKRLEALVAFLEEETPNSQGTRKITSSLTHRYLNEQIDLYLARKATLEARVERAASSFGIAEQVVTKMQERVELARQRKARAQERCERGLSTIADLDRETDRLDQTIAEGLQADLRMLDARDRFDESLAAVENERLEIQQQFTSELYQAETEVERLQTELSLFEASRERSDVHATVNGTVQSVDFASAGEVVPAGAVIASILPEDDQLVAKVRIKPTDIGHVDADTTVRLSLTAFDVRRYGYVDGRVLSISPTAELDPNKEPFYEVTVSLSKKSLTYEGVSKNVQAGMEVAAEFRSENRSLLEYFVGPVQRVIGTSFTERG